MLFTVILPTFCVVLHQDECSFVSLRDVDRALTVTSWFLKQARESHTLFDLLKKKLQPEAEEDEGADAESLGSVGLEDEDEEEVTLSDYINYMTKCLGTVTHVSLCSASLAGKIYTYIYIV